ncbi:F-box/WD repeat-containing protein [Endozoicomonas sp. ALD040]|uniref:F-box/WD repeat-containing protein n=1 Tax=unclassified Endozoicomonas TaxID=2644528 RepID=UPI003BAE715C
MHVINNDSVIKPPITQTQTLSLTPTGNSAGRSVAVTDKEKKSSFQDLASDTLSLIFRHLKLRDIRSLQKVCTRLRDVIKEDNTLAKAWFRQFSSAHQNQLRMSINTKDKNQLRAWFELFSNDQALLKSLTDRQPTSVYSPALLFFTRAELMSQCETFEPVTKATIDKTYKANSATSDEERDDIPHKNKIYSACLSADGRYLVTGNGDCTAKIYGHKPDGTWEIKTIIPHGGGVGSVTFSPNTQHLVTAGGSGKAKIYDLRCDESWEPNTTIRHYASVRSATFSTDSRQLVTASCDKTVKIHSQKDDGSWQLTATLPHNDAVFSASFSTDGSHLVTACWDHSARIYSQKNGSWKVKKAIPHREAVLSATFSADGNYVVTASQDGKAKIYTKKEDGSWEENFIIEHRETVHSATFSPDSRHLVTASDDGTVRIYDRTASGTWERETTFRPGKIRYGFPRQSVGTKGFATLCQFLGLSATFSPDGRHMVFYHKTAIIVGQRDDGSWSEKASITHDERIISATFSADGSLVITASLDGIVKITELRRNHILFDVTEWHHPECTERNFVSFTDQPVMNFHSEIVSDY